MQHTVAHVCDVCFLASISNRFANAVSRGQTPVHEFITLPTGSSALKQSSNRLQGYQPISPTTTMPSSHTRNNPYSNPTLLPPSPSGSLSQPSNSIVALPRGTPIGSNQRGYRMSIPCTCLIGQSRVSKQYQAVHSGLRTGRWPLESR